MQSARHLFVSLILAFMILVIGTIGYMMIESWEFTKSVITVSTVGYGEVRQVDYAGRNFTIIIVLTGVGFSLYFAGAVVQFMVEGQIRQIMGRRRLDQKLRRLKNHYIICGYDRIGRVLVRNLRRKLPNLVVIDNNPHLVSVMEEDGVLYVSGDATEESTLIKAGIGKAKGLVSALATDTNNVFLIAIEKATGEMLFNPSLEAVFEAEDTLIAVGEEPNLHALARDLSPTA